MSLNKILKNLFFSSILFVGLLILSKSALCQEITAINFNGEPIGKVIPDGKVVSFENKLIGNVTADSLIINSKGELIGGVVPQGVAIGIDAQFLGKVSSDGSVRSSSGQLVGKALPIDPLIILTYSAFASSSTSLMIAISAQSPLRGPILKICV